MRRRREPRGRADCRRERPRGQRLAVPERRTARPRARSGAQPCARSAMRCRYRKTPLADDPDDARRRAARVRPVQLGRRRSRVRARRQDLEPGADRQHPAPARRRPAVLRAARGSSSSRSLTADFGASWSTNERVSQHPRDAARPVADGAGAAADHRYADRDRPRRCRRVRARLADRPHGDDRLHGRPVDLHPRLHHRVPVRVRLQARLVPGAGLGRQLRREPVRATRRCRS